MYPYSKDFEPPAPVLAMECWSPAGGPMMEVAALLDSGADITVIPSRVVTSLELRETGSVTAVGFSGTQVEIDVFSVSIRVPGKEPTYARVVPWDGDYALMGRDLINSWRVTLDGPAQGFNLS